MGRTDRDEVALVDALAALYSYVYDRPASTVRAAAADRALAMRIWDAWVADGCSLEDPRIDEERAFLVRSYSALLDAVGPGSGRA